MSETSPEQIPEETVAAPIADVAPSYDPTYVSQLENYYRQTSPVLEKIAPIYDDLKPMLEDEEKRSFVKNSLSYYDKAKAEREPKLSPEFETLKSQLLAEFQPVIELTRDLRKEQQDQRASRDREATDANQAYFQKLRSQDVFKENGGQRLQQLINYAVANGLALEAAHKQFYSVAEAVPESQPQDEPSPQAKRPPSETKSSYEQSGGDIHSLILNSVKKAQRSRAS